MSWQAYETQHTFEVAADLDFVVVEFRLPSGDLAHVGSQEQKYMLQGTALVGDQMMLEVLRPGVCKLLVRIRGSLPVEELGLEAASGAGEIVAGAVHVPPSSCRVFSADRDQGGELLEEFPVGSPVGFAWTTPVYSDLEGNYVEDDNPYQHTLYLWSASRPEPLDYIFVSEENAARSRVRAAQARERATTSSTSRALPPFPRLPSVSEILSHWS